MGKSNPASPTRRGSRSPERPKSATSQRGQAAATDPRIERPGPLTGNEEATEQLIAPPGGPLEDWAEPEPDTGRMDVIPLVGNVQSATAHVAPFDTDQSTPTIEFPIRGRLRIGRDSANEIHLPGDSLVSRFHAVLQLNNTMLSIRDLGSTNGTFVNNVRVKTTMALSDQSTILIGRTLIWISAEMAKPVDSADPATAQSDAELLREWRKDRGWTQADLAEQLKVSQRAVSLWENGEPISTDNREKLRTCGCPV